MWVLEHSEKIIEIFFDVTGTCDQEQCDVHEENVDQNEQTGASKSSPDSEKDEQDERVLSLGDLYLRAIVGACLLLWTVKRAWLLSVFAIPLIYCIIKKLSKLVFLA